MLSFVQLGYGVPAAALVCVLLSTLASLIEISHLAKTREVRTILCVQFWLYWAVMVTGSLAVAGSLWLGTRELVVANSPWAAVPQAFFGVILFAFGPRQVNVTYFGAEIHVSEWVNRVRDNAVGAAVQLEVEQKAHFEQRATAVLRHLPETEINTYLKVNGNESTITMIDKDVSVDRLLYKAMLIAAENPELARAVMKERSKMHAKRS